MPRRLIPVALALIALPARADDTVTVIESRPLNELWLNPGFLSRHFNSSENHNENNYGIGAEYRFSTVASAAAGRYYNSYRRYSNYLGIYYQPVAIGAVRLGVLAGGFDGYPKMHAGNGFPGAIPMASYEHGAIGVNVAFIPPLGDRLPGAVALQLKIRVSD